MKIGLVLGCQFPVGADRVMALNETLEQARHASAAGFDALWVGHHYLADFQYLQVVPMLARLAAEVPGMTLGTHVFLLPLHRAVEVAEQFATLDVITGGHLILGVAQGYRKEEFTALGVPIEQKASRMAEHIQVIRRLWTEDKVTFAGRHTQLEDAVSALKPLQRPGPPIWIGATTPAAIKRAATLGDGWIMTLLAGFAEAKERVALFRETLAAGGRPTNLPILMGREAFCAPTREEAIAIARGPLTTKYEAYARWGRSDITVDDLLSTGSILGSPQDCIEQLTLYKETLGIEHFSLRMQWPGIDQEHVLRSIELFGSQVLPAIR